MGNDEIEIGFEPIKNSAGPYCGVDDWAILRWKMWSQSDGTLLEDTDAASEFKLPVTALIGHY